VNPTVRIQVAELSRRSIIRTLRQPAQIVPSMLFPLILLAINAALPLLMPTIAWQAHLGGLVAGFLVGLAWGTVGESRTREAARTVAAAAVGLVALAFVML
jgi:membrane associated rhomboid family serine protease